MTPGGFAPRSTVIPKKPRHSPICAGWLCDGGAFVPAGETRYAAASARYPARESRPADARPGSPRARGGPDHQPGHGQHVLQLPACRVVELPRQHVTAPAVDQFGRFAQAGAVAADRPLATIRLLSELRMSARSNGSRTPTAALPAAGPKVVGNFGRRPLAQRRRPARRRPAPPAGCWRPGGWRRASRATHLAGAPQPGQRGPALGGRPSPRRSCSGRRAAPGSIPGDVQVELGARRRSPGSGSERSVSRCDIELDVREGGFLHLGHDRPAHHVARGQFGSRIVVGHEAFAVFDRPVRPSPRMASVIRCGCCRRCRGRWDGTA